jgi:hypothetical protein
MKILNCLLILCFLYSSPSLAKSTLAEFTDRCGELPSLRERLAGAEQDLALQKEMLEYVNRRAHARGLAAYSLPANNFEAGLASMKIELAKIESVCSSVKSHRATFIGTLDGYEPITFQKRLLVVLKKFELVTPNLKIDDESTTRLIDATKTVFSTLPNMISYAFEKDPIKRAAFEFEIMTASNGFAVVLFDILQVDRTNVTDVDTLFARLDAKLNEFQAQEEL